MPTRMQGIGSVIFFALISQLAMADVIHTVDEQTALASWKIDDGDFGWGMTSFALAPGERFDLKVSWSVAGVKKEAWIREIRCAEER